MKLYLDSCCFNRPFDNQSIVRNRLETEAKGIRTKDALHISCAIESGADYVITTDDKLLNKNIEGIVLINPIDFVRKETKHDS